MAASSCCATCASSCRNSRALMRSTPARSAVSWMSASDVTTRTDSFLPISSASFFHVGVRRLALAREDHVQAAAVELLPLPARHAVAVEHDHDLAAREGGVVTQRVHEPLARSVDMAAVGQGAQLVPGEDDVVAVHDHALAPGGGTARRALSRPRRARRCARGRHTARGGSGRTRAAGSAPAPGRQDQTGGGTSAAPAGASPSPPCRSRCRGAYNRARDPTG